MPGGMADVIRYESLKCAPHYGTAPAGKKPAGADFGARQGTPGRNRALIGTYLAKLRRFTGLGRVFCMTTHLGMYLGALAVIALSLAILMALAWAVQQRTGNSGWVDTIWTFSVGLVGAGSALWPDEGGTAGSRQWLVAALVALWSCRLGLHIAARSAGAADDPRYAAFAREWGIAAPRRMFVFLQSQALGSVPLVFAIFVAAHVPEPALRLQDFLGAAILLLGILGEGLADAQLKRFRHDGANKGRVCDVGLWRWSRHPNYFFEWLCWLAFPVIGLSPGYAWGWASLLAPVFMYWILVHVTGIPPLEAQMLRSRGERYRAYQARTSRFFPLPPRKASREASREGAVT